MGAISREDTRRIGWTVEQLNDALDVADALAEAAQFVHDRQKAGVGISALCAALAAYRAHVAGQGGEG